MRGLFLKGLFTPNDQAKPEQKQDPRGRFRQGRGVQNVAAVAVADEVVAQIPTQRGTVPRQHARIAKERVDRDRKHVARRLEDGTARHVEEVQIRDRDVIA